MKTIQDIKQLKHDILTTSNSLRGLENLRYAKHITTHDRDIKSLVLKLTKLDEVYNSAIIGDTLKDAYIIDELKKQVRPIDVHELDELLNDYDESYYNDASIEWIYDYIYEVFRDDMTLRDIDDSIDKLFGYYSNNLLAHCDDQFYLFLEY